MIARKTNGAGDAFLWNLSATVGSGQVNRPDDVQFVALGYYLMARSVGFSGDVAAAFAKVNPSATYSGQRDDPLTLAIQAHERLLGGKQDGIVSPFRPAQATYDGSHRWISRILNDFISLAAVRSWPRLDGVEGAPGLLVMTTKLACLPQT